EKTWFQLQKTLDDSGGHQEANAFSHRKRLKLKFFYSSIKNEIVISLFHLFPLRRSLMNLDCNHVFFFMLLSEYLEVHQTELDKLTSLMKDMKRNSRLQIKSIERYMRRLEFHISKVDELYEAFCIQSRLRDGAIRMKQAFSSSPSTKATKESISEVNRRYKEYTEVLSSLCSHVFSLIGLAGFARLCPGDQYEVSIFMRYGRQRWKLKGRIEVNSRQSWDGDEMVFMPLITDLINIKVTELKGLATHMLVGSVICETKELFTARPQVVAVDVNDLGTIKLNLEVTW
uniref:Rho family-interacting cell polarization regulator 2 n=1 Tax=Cyprinodon variegatus TaxID=28743 RepID=A0A3Q2CAU7_CYPVA